MKTPATLAEQLHEACHQAIQECPQFQGYDDDQQILVAGRTVIFGELPNKGLSAVVSFWKDPDTEANRLLFEMGYDAALAPEYKAVFDRYDALVNRALGELEAEFS